MLLDNHVCIVVGSGSPRGIGYAAARMLASHGAKVVASDIQMTDDVAEAIDAAAGGRKAVAGIACDITSIAHCDALVAQALDRFGRVDCLINSAGIVESIPFSAIDDLAFDRMMGVNLKGTFNLCKAVLPVMKAQGRGSIINMSSLAAQRGGGLVGGAHYAASKGGVLSLTKSIAREYGAFGIRANAICPAMIETEMLDGLSGERQKAIIDQIPLRRLGTADEVAGACLFLASDLGGFVTGATIDVNGGNHIH
jgi:NAD(P)-dependent dehydrogenase (short-subunit alcohol dehydrogenase family)